ncbi:MAG: hypothetical protein OQJ89_09330 [Kangiellaceae bacterium]|nr:hypothetical protein [Kangiellaceae bacterium]MCW8998239.1 hypothetical protein [Kangiellaceae bacterium]MCW9017154.1 hypothetical protein [Kangiellaceae bacterium]
MGKQNDTSSLIKEEYENWLENGWGDRSHLPLTIITAIHLSQSLDGFDELPSWIVDSIIELLDDYKRTGEMKVITSAGEFEHTEKMAAFERLYREKQKS